MSRTAARALRRTVGAVVLAGVAASTALVAAPAGASTEQVDVIVRSTDGDLTGLAADVIAAGGSVDRELGIIGGLSATVPAGALDGLLGLDSVLSVTPDAAVELHGLDTPDVGDVVEVLEAAAPSTGAGATIETVTGPVLEDAETFTLSPLEEDDDDDLPEDEGQLDWVRHVTGAEEMHAAGLLGQGVDVAIIDSGVTRVRGFEEADKLVIGPDVSFEGGNAELRGMDTFGHGTHLAGIINGDDKKGEDLGKEYGIAPEARLISVKAADATGATDVSQVISAIDWVVQHGRTGGLNIRVLNLAFGTDADQSYVLDPLAYAVETAWKNGIVVVVAAGNRGHLRTGLDNPATNPFVLSVGSTDTNGTLDVADDTVPAWSGKGDGIRNPDIVAPGRSIVSLRVKNSFVDARYGDVAKVDKHYLKGSGTSQSSAVVSGLVALLVQAHPDWTPDQVKAALKATAHDLDAFGPEADGAGSVDVAAAVTYRPTPNDAQIHIPATGLGSIQRSRGSFGPVVDGTPIEGEVDAMGNAWNGASWSGASWSGASWSGGEWTGASWSGASWSGASWSGASWSGGEWMGASWSGASWSGASWSGASWSGSEWSGASWSSAEWQGDNWNASMWG